MDFISEQLDNLGIEHYPIAHSGILARIEGRRGNLKRCVVLRAAIDAQPHAELTGVEWASLSDGVMHSSGHDFDAAVLFGVVCRLHQSRDFEGTLLALFQSGEGAQNVLSEDPFREYDIAAVIAQSVDSELEIGEFGFCPGKYLASSDEFDFSIRPESAARCNSQNNPVVAMADLILRLNMLNSDVCIISICRAMADGQADSLPEQSSCQGQVCTFNEKLRARIKEMIHHSVEEIEYKYDVEVQTNICQGSPCVENDAQLSYEAMLLADSNGYVVKDLDVLLRTDDFGHFTQLYPSLYYRVGVGRQSGQQHTATFLPDEKALSVGEEFMYELALSILNK